MITSPSQVDVNDYMVRCRAAYCTSLDAATEVEANKAVCNVLSTYHKICTATTGKAHWEPLLRARAIESQAYVIAPGQFGHHDDDGLRDSHGHSMIIDPWGTVLACCADGVGLCLAEIDLERVKKVRRGMPCASPASNELQLVKAQRLSANSYSCV